MSGSLLAPRAALSITDGEYRLFQRLVREETGINLSDRKRSLLCSRLARRLRHHGMATFSEYHEYLKRSDPFGDELRQLVNCMTTNMTSFFREAHHFEFLRNELLPQRRARAERGEPSRLRIWSAGCSTGEEAYSIGMTLLDAFGSLVDWDAKILASDVDTDVLSRAEAGVFKAEAVERLAPRLRRRFFRRLPGESRVRVSEELRAMITFRAINLVHASWPIRSRFDAIFCRNVMIYFDRATQEQLHRRLAERLASHGYLITGHSETLHFLPALFVRRGSTIYEKVGDPTDHVARPARVVERK